jgi:hypothetical protein
LRLEPLPLFDDAGTPQPEEREFGWWADADDEADAPDPTLGLPPKVARQASLDPDDGVVL